MNVWIDISNSPHVNFFKQFIEEWQVRHNVIVTARHLSNTLDLLKKNNIEYQCVGSHYGKKKISKIFGFFKRTHELYIFLKNKKIDIAISQSSFYSPYVAKKLNIPCIYTNDNEYAKGNYVAFLLAEHILLPEALKSWTKGRFFEKKVAFYPGVKEGIYTKQVTKKLKPAEKIIYFRPEPWNAQYHDYVVNTFDNMLIKLASLYKIIVLPRDHMQSKHFGELAQKIDNIHVPSNVETIESIAEKCDIFLGAGGSMTREFAFMGIPTVSMYQGKPLAVDSYLINKGLLINQRDPSKIDLKFINSLNIKRDTLNSSYKDIYDQGKLARRLITGLIENNSPKLKNALNRDSFT